MRALVVIATCVTWLLGATPASAAPTITGAPAPGPVVLGPGTLTDSVTVSGRVTPQPGATITFSLYGPHDPTCNLAPVFSPPPVEYPVTDELVTSAPYTPIDAGTHRWRAAYSGDLNNAPVTSECEDVNQAREVLRATPTIATAASPGRGVGDPITDTASVSGRVNPQPGATIEFELYGPDDGACLTSPASRSTVSYPVFGGDVTSAPFLPSQPGTYRWRAFYSGDANNAPVDGACNAAGEIATVSPPPPPPPPPPPQPPPAPPPPPPVPPAEAFVCPPTGLVTGAVYRGTHSQGRGFCFTLSPDFTRVTSYLATGVEGSGCGFDELARYRVGIPITNYAFADPDGSFSGTLGRDRTAQGTIQLTATDGSGTCRTPRLTWTASTAETPPWTTPPPPPPLPPPPASIAAIKLTATAVQRPLRQGGIVVRVSCGTRACTARVATTIVASRTTPTTKLTTVKRGIDARATSRLTLRLTRAARRFITRAFGRGRSVRANVTARVTDAAGRLTTKRATIRLTR